MSEDSLGWLLKEIGRYPVLPQEEVRRLIAIAQSDDPGAKRAKQKVVTHNLKLVVSIAKRYTRRCKTLELSDLIGEGARGLQRAVEKFDLGAETQLSTYATWWIRQAITRKINDSDRLIRLPVNRFEKYARVKKASQELRLELGRAPTLEEIGAEIEETVDWVERFISLPAITSLNAKVKGRKGEENTELGELIPIEEDQSPLEYAVAYETQECVRAILSRMRPRDRQILEMRFGLDDGIAKSLEQIGECLELSREGVRQIEKRAKQRFKQLAIKNQSFKTTSTLLNTQEIIMSRRNIVETRNALEDALTELMASSQPFTLKTLASRAKTGTSVFYKEEFSDIKDKADKAIAQLRNKQSAITSAITADSDPITDHLKRVSGLSQPTVDTSQTTALEQRIQELERNNGELKAQVQALQTQNSDQLVLKALQTDEMRLKASLQRIEEEMQDLESERQAVLAKLHGIQALFEFRTGERVQSTFELIVTPHNGNGHHLIKNAS